MESSDSMEVLDDGEGEVWKYLEEGVEFSCTNSPTSCTWRKVADGYKRDIVSLPKHHIRIIRVFATLM